MTETHLGKLQFLHDEFLCYLNSTSSTEIILLKSPSLKLAISPFWLFLRFSSLHVSEAFDSVDHYLLKCPLAQVLCATHLPLPTSQNMLLVTIT